MSLLRVENLCKSYQLNKFAWFSGKQLAAIKNINFSLDAGKTLAIVGESGSGKSTLGRQIIGMEQPSAGKIFLSDELIKYNNKAQRQARFKNIRMIFQNPAESLNPQSRIGDLLDQVLLINTDLTAKKRKQKIEETLVRVGLLPSHQYRYAEMFSGGQLQRIAIARAIILEPQIIIADEPLSSLDASIQAQILNLLQELQEDMNISYLFISHDLNVVDRIADHVMVLFQGEIAEYGSVAQVFDNPLHPYTQTLFSSTPLYKNRVADKNIQIKKNPQTQFSNGCNFSARCYLRKSDCEINRPSLTELKNGHQFSCFHSLS